MPSAPTRVRLRPLTDADREAIATWRYPEPLSIYDPGEGARSLRGPEHLALVSDEDELLGYTSEGEEARVPGGTYEGGAAVVDLGLGLRPDRVGQGLGAPALRALMAHVRARGGALRVRATVASANGRARALVEGLGFRATHRFVRARDGRDFTQYERPAAENAG